MRGRMRCVLLTFLLAVLSLIAGLSGCADQDTRVESPTISEAETVGPITLAIRLSKRAAVTLARMEVVISGSDMEAMQVELTLSGDTATGTVLGIPAGQKRQFRVNGYDAMGAVAYTGSTEVDLPAGEIVPVHVVVRPVQESSGGGELGVDLPGGATMEFVWIEPGTFTMGSPDSELERGLDEGPQHEVTISRGFYLGKYEITQAQWEAVMGTTPWSGQDFVQANPNHPAVYISWEDVQELIARLNEAAGGEVYRFPSEAEWEYACRAGTTTRWSFGDDESRLGEYAWYYDNAWSAGLQYAQPVGTKLPNPWGLFDMHGNVWEWCQDWLGEYTSDNQTDPTGPAAGSTRVVRGVHFGHYARNTRSAYRYYYSPSSRNGRIGARLLRTK